MSVLVVLKGSVLEEAEEESPGKWPGKWRQCDVGSG